ncbi:MAG: hypothetical protein INQ03_18900 [Candidatus Heimdallarchaeota archaeon]|nr:hypothetical protein [Candidatus Heimdallarchaeota archaeon]
MARMNPKTIALIIFVMFLFIINLLYYIPIVGNGDETGLYKVELRIYADHIHDPTGTHAELSVDVNAIRDSENDLGRSSAIRKIEINEWSDWTTVFSRLKLDNDDLIQFTLREYDVWTKSIFSDSINPSESIAGEITEGNSYELTDDGCIINYRVTYLGIE